MNWEANKFLFLVSIFDFYESSYFKNFKKSFKKLLCSFFELV